MADLQQYKCPCCGGAIEFNSSVQKMKCPFCDTEFEMDTLLEYDKELSNPAEDSFEWKQKHAKEWKEDESSGMRIFVCQSCGGEIVADENTAAKSCPFCDNPVVVMGSVTGNLKPEFIIPFKLDKKAAKEKFKQHLADKKLLPEVFKTENHIEEIKGIYVPYWLFDSKANASMKYRGTKLRYWSDSKYNYTETSHYLITREGDIAFEDVPVDGSSKLADDLMESLEPYNVKEGVPFQTAYFAGYLADKYDVDQNAAMVRANERVKNSTMDAFQRTVRGYSSVRYDSGNINLEKGEITYAMYPVWLMTTKWNGQTYTFAMNGQTGKFVGNLPCDQQKANKYLLSIAGITTAVLFAIMSIVYFI